MAELCNGGIALQDFHRTVKLTTKSSFWKQASNVSSPYCSGSQKLRPTCVWLIHVNSVWLVQPITSPICWQTGFSNSRGLSASVSFLPILHFLILTLTPFSVQTKQWKPHSLVILHSPIPQKCLLCKLIFKSIFLENYMFQCEFNKITVNQKKLLSEWQISQLAMKFAIKYISNKAFSLSQLEHFGLNIYPKTGFLVTVSFLLPNSSPKTGGFMGIVQFCLSGFWVIFPHSIF